MWVQSLGWADPLEKSMATHSSILAWRIPWAEEPAAAAAAVSLQSCPTLCDPIDVSPPGSPVPGISRQEYRSGLPLPSPCMNHAAAAAAKSLQSCPTLCDPIDGSPPVGCAGSSRLRGRFL